MFDGDPHGSGVTVDALPPSFRFVCLHVFSSCALRRYQSSVVYARCASSASTSYAEGQYLDKGYEVMPEEEPEQPLGKTFLFGILAAVLAATAYVCNAVGQAGAF